MADEINNSASNDPITLIDLNGLETYTGYVERKSQVLTYQQYINLPTEQKNNGTSYYVPDAIQAPTILNDVIFSLTETLEAGSTTVTFTDNRLVSTSKVQVYCEVGSDLLTPTASSEGTHSLTLTFDAQSSDVDVCIVVFNV